MKIFVTQNNGLMCPQCGGRLLCAVEQYSTGVVPYYTNDGYGAFFDETVDANPDDGAREEFTMKRLYCDSCGFSLYHDEGDLDDIEIADRCRTVDDCAEIFVGNCIDCPFRGIPEENWPWRKEPTP